MNKPKAFEEVQAFGGYTPIEVGGHIMIIKKVEETISRTNKAMLRIYLDTDKTDKQPCYFSESYKNDTRENKKWKCINYCMVEDSNGNCSRSLKTFIESVEKSNNGFKVQWGENFANCLVNKLVGAVFGREEYLDSYGESRFATKCLNFRTVEDVREGRVQAPKDRLLKPSDNVSYEDLNPVNDTDMPF